MTKEKAIEILESVSWSGYDDKEIAEAVQMGAEALKEIPQCKFRSPINCEFCAFHSDCEEHWKE